MTRPRHPKPEIEKAVQYAEELGWRVELSNGHAWGGSFVPKVLEKVASSVLGRLRKVRKITHGKSEKWWTAALTALVQKASLAMNSRKVMTNEPNHKTLR